MGVDMSNNPQPTSRSCKDLFASPALSLSLAGIFRNAGPKTQVGATTMEVEEMNEGSVGRKREDGVEISSTENSGPAGSKSYDDYFDGDGDEDDGYGDNKNKNKKRKKYHRHTTEQIREMEALFKESPHPDEKQRQQLSKRLGLHPRQVKFWFQNRRTQIKAIQERHENSLMKSELDRLREEIRMMRATMNKGCCPNCGTETSGRDIAMRTDEQKLLIENAKLKAEVEKLRAALLKCPQATASPSCSSGNDQENKSSLDFYNGIFGLERTKIIELANQAVEELVKMATTAEPLWVRSVETGREILNYDEYMKKFNIAENSSTPRLKTSIEASRDTGVALVDLPRLVQCFMDVEQWKEMFPCLISKAVTVDVICNGEEPNRNGAMQLMFAELQMLTPMVPTREVYFVRYCKQLNAQQWAIVDVSIDKVEDNINASPVKCRKRPSGCIIEDKSNSHCKVIWVEHQECQKSTTQAMYRTIINNGFAFGAGHWMATLQLQCERQVFFTATNVPMKDSTGVDTLAGRKSLLKLAQRMTWGFCRALGASSCHNWAKVAGKTGEDIRISSRKNLNDPGEPTGVILCAVSSVWLPVAPHVLFDFLRDEAHRNEWDIMLSGGKVKSIANLAKGQDRGNAVTIQSTQLKESRVWILQDSCTNGYESMVVYAPVDINATKSVMTGCNSSSIAILPSGFSILPDGVESRPLVITSRQEEKRTEGGSLLTLAFQLPTSSSPSAKITKESVESVKTLISSILKNIKTCLQCEDN